MTESKVIDYINDTLSQGFSENEVKAALKKQGWSDLDIDEAMRAAAPRSTSPPKRTGAQASKKPEQPKAEKGKAAQGKPGKSLVKGGFILTAVGGMLIIVNALLIYLGFGDMLGFVMPNPELSVMTILGLSLTGMDVFLINLVIGVFLAAASFITYAMPYRRKLTGMFIIMLSLVSALVGNGFLVGGIAGLIGGALAVMDK